MKVARNSIRYLIIIGLYQNLAHGKYFYQSCCYYCHHRKSGFEGTKGKRSTHFATEKQNLSLTTFVHMATPRICFQNNLTTEPTTDTLGSSGSSAFRKCQKAGSPEQKQLQTIKNDCKKFQIAVDVQGVTGSSPVSSTS